MVVIVLIVVDYNVDYCLIVLVVWVAVCDLLSDCGFLVFVMCIVDCIDAVVDALVFVWVSGLFC